MISKLSRDTLRLDVKKPTEIEHTFTASYDGSGGIQAESTSFKGRIRSDQVWDLTYFCFPSADHIYQNVRLNVQTRNGQIVVRGETGRNLGRKNNIATTVPLQTDKTVMTLTTIGQDAPTAAEAKRANNILAILQGSRDVLENPWIQNIWFPDPSGLLVWPETWLEEDTTAALTSAAPQIHTPSISPGYRQKVNPSSPVQYPLNVSQQEAVDTMLSMSTSHRITLIQGPPGTGKTSVIARFVQTAVESGRTGIWLVAQSNVAAKNIAEKLGNVGFRDWRLLVSKDFHLDWYYPALLSLYLLSYYYLYRHEHIYHQVKDKIIRSEEFRRISSNRLFGCKVIICTLSMLANRLIGRFITQVPFKTLVVDEASQIEIGEYFSCFQQRTTLRKVCFIGDDKQCMFSSSIFYHI